MIPYHIRIKVIKITGSGEPIRSNIPPSFNSEEFKVQKKIAMDRFNQINKAKEGEVKK